MYLTRYYLLLIILFLLVLLFYFLFYVIFDPFFSVVKVTKIHIEPNIFPVQLDSSELIFEEKQRMYVLTGGTIYAMMDFLTRMNSYELSEIIYVTHFSYISSEKLLKNLIAMYIFLLYIINNYIIFCNYFLFISNHFS